ncbi:DDB1- and CUL4-associated factor 10-like [Patiria miniata]|uniref:WD repeat-containing protein 32 n=1 Tax=Patiria miniata TaxID=46514 RepID=A0A914B4M1_PATMI|nr:DDB1- and CUL4-associated factor 10-like [Patiria miniata]XP_038071014.1 DDB1- and CUL4-associated factor 10-like [Patiria miniata]XP_038071015.1 DDB1- and CUL4-associated factor 10-like [Patiria miniata]XP_038071016.1 DDB1- and CUL4-associated factor 10-like [Patiria miniata]XP_038071076.1 DDB1- and CUL4-associated factor 10-like [Patiria miniata]XP_038071077.1 DDB1- and CUL4-associated factor 10-like [Patiria miniata]XP_038071078.1 DDB1- and CUL4-associated factor 10-like [Patiria miniat
MAVNKKSKDNSAGTTNANSVSQKTSISSWVRNRPTAHPASVCAGSAIGVHYRANVGSCQQRLLSEIKCCLYSRVAPSGFSDFSKQNGHEAIFNLEFSPNGDVLVAACEENSMLLFDPLTTKHITAVRNAHSDCVNCIRFLDSRTFASGSDDSTIALWDIRNLKQKIRCLQGHTNWVKSIEYCRQTRRLVTSAFDGNVVTWDINGYEEKGTPHEKVFYIESLMRTRLTPDCTKLVMSTARGFYIIVHDLNLSTLNSDLAGLDFARHYQGVGLGEEPSEFDGELGLERIWQGRRRGRNRVELVSDFPDGSKASCISSLVVHPQGWAMMSRYTTRDNDAEWTCVHDLQDPVPEASHGDTVVTRPPAKRLMYYTKEPTDGQGYIKELSVSPDGRLICSSYGFGIRLLAFDDKSSELCDIQPHTVRELRQVKFLVRHKSTVLTSRFSPTHCLLVSGSMCGRVAFYQPKL